VCVCVCVCVCVSVRVSSHARKARASLQNMTVGHANEQAREEKSISGLEREDPGWGWVGGCVCGGDGWRCVCGGVCREVCGLGRRGCVWWGWVEVCVWRCV